MRKLSLIIIATFIVFAASASDTLRVESNNEKSTKPKVVNMNEVLQSTVYPKELRELGIEGEVIVSIWLDPNGDLLRYRVDESSHAKLQSFVETKIPLLEFQPAKDDLGINTYSRVKLPFQFDLSID